MAINDLLAKLETQMQHTLDVVRAELEHRGNKGASVEATVREFIRRYLPQRYGVGHGEIIDPEGRRTGQTDVVVTNDNHPFTFTEGSPGLFFREGIFALGEVKSVLTSQDLETTIQNARRFRELRPKPTFGTVMGTNRTDSDRYQNNPGYFLFAFESQLKMETILQTMAGI